jgi:hypothetical protein
MTMPQTTHNPGLAPVSYISKMLVLREKIISCKPEKRRDALIPIPSFRTLLMTPPAIRPQVLLNDIAFLAWVSQAEPEYHRGFLARDTFPTFEFMERLDKEQLRGLARQAMIASEQGLVHLVQKRLELDHFSYVAIARPKTAATQSTLSQLVAA